ncbi:protein of unknown function [Methylocaldum szegediense]|uniref:Uncharacterized protein n=1 Tax=Methylocaldum szegediense TaxID=73780 RepID=A0ABN8X8Y8_9GAMM|nr:protein of unknown function [Methylocaldum szegediense]
MTSSGAHFSQLGTAGANTIAAGVPITEEVDSRGERFFCGKFVVAIKGREPWTRTGC